jgi:hypothetical protein
VTRVYEQHGAEKAREMYEAAFRRVHPGWSPIRNRRARPAGERSGESPAIARQPG